MESAYEWATLLGRMRNVPSERPCSRRSASARLHDISHIFSSRWGKGVASAVPARPLLLVSIRLSRLWWLSPQSNNHLVTDTQQTLSHDITSRQQVTDNSGVATGCGRHLLGVSKGRKTPKIKTKIHVKIQIVSFICVCVQYKQSVTASVYLSSAITPHSIATTTAL